MSAQRKTRTLSIALLAVLTIFLASGEGKADVLGICNPDGPGQCTASVSLTGNLLTVSLTNTSLTSGYITAVAFNFTPGTTIVNNSYTTTNANFLFTQGVIQVSPEPNSNALFSATNNPDPAYLGGGSPNGGVAVGSTVTFTVTLSSLNGNTEEDIFNSMRVRLRGFTGDPDSDKDNLILTQVPEPATMLLLGSGLIGIAARIRRRRKARKA